MISAFIGSPGCGKTTALSWLANKALKHPNRPISICGIPVTSGRTQVFTNFEFPNAYKIDYEDLGKYRYEDALILLDEMTMLADSRDFKQFEKSKRFFFSQHRKFECDIVWTSQAYDDTDKKIRNLTVQYFMLSRHPLFPLGCFRSIEHFTDIREFKIVSGYEYGKKQYFLTRPIYKLFDSYATVAVDKNSLPLPPLEKWGEIAE